MSSSSRYEEQQMADLDEIIDNAITAAETGGAPDDLDTHVADETPEEPEETEETPDETETPEEDAEEAPAPDATDESEPEKKPEEKKPEEKKESAEDAEITKLLEEHGIKAPVKGQRDNKIPYSRIRKITGNFIKKVRTTHQQELQTRDAGIRDRDEQLRAVEATNQLIETDPDRYVTMLAALHPKLYGKFLKGGVVEHPASTEIPDEANDPKPGPDQKFEDGTFGYSPEQHDKLMEWSARRGARQAVAQMEKRFGPIESAYKSNQYRAAILPSIQQEIERLRGLWGDDFTEDEKKAGPNGQPGESKILQYMSSHRGCTFAEAAAAVLLPIRQEREAALRAKVRTETLDEQRRRAAGGQRPAGSTKPVKETPKPGSRSLDDVINEAIDAAGLK